ncbi:MAG: sugar ABC transporter ATP-binding protein, partial [Firmicutes bacterium]|nr:sugar ABC transporter ATP-binding protein [Bacillota bacterium]
EGKAIIFISHKLDEVQQISDRVTVLRDGRLVGTLAREQASTGKIVSMMVGRDIDEFYPPKAKRRDGRVLLEAFELSRDAKFKDISFDLRVGEILGLYGLVGSGRTELALSLVGADRLDSGSVRLAGMPFSPKSPRQAVNNGLCYLSEDRKQLGLFLEMSLADNVVSSSLENVCGPLGTMQTKRIEAIASKLVEQLDVIPKRTDSVVSRLSGGNQQKVLLAKWLATSPRILIVDEPSRGVDIGAKSKIHFLLRELADSGMAVLMISSDLPEILGLSDRIMVMHEGQVRGILENVDLTQEVIMNIAYGEAVTA